MSPSSGTRTPGCSGGELGQYDSAKAWYRGAIACKEPPADSILFVELAKYSEYPKRGIEVCEQRLRGGQLFGRGTRPIR